MIISEHEEFQSCVCMCLRAIIFKYYPRTHHTYIHIYKRHNRLISRRFLILQALAYTNIQIVIAVFFCFMQKLARFKNIRECISTSADR